jgi:hypothetical protein
MAPFKQIVLANITPEGVASKLRSIGCVVHATDTPSKNAANSTLDLTYNGVEPYSICVLTQFNDSPNTAFVFMGNVRDTTLLDFVAILFSPILGIIDIFKPRHEYTPSKQEVAITEGRAHIENALKSDSAFIEDGFYRGNLYP